MNEMNPIQFCCNVSQANSEYIMTKLPQRRTKVTEVRESKSLLHVRLYTECTDVEQIKAWIREYEEITKTTYSIRNTVNSAGRYVLFKQTLHCQHNTRSKNLYDISKKIYTRNTNCSAAITITLHAIKKRYQGKDKETYLLRKELPSEFSMVLTHNHSTESADALKYRRVTNDVREKLLELFHNDHSPATALEALKNDIYLTNDNPEFILADRSQCPDYMYCYHLFMKFKENYVNLNQNTTSGDVIPSCANPSNVEIEQELPEQCMERGRTAIERVTKVLTHFLEETPTSDVANGLEKMCENAERVHTTAAFLSSCSNFALEYHGRNRTARFGVQPTAMRGKKINISGRQAKKSSKNNLKNKSPHNLSQVFKYILNK